MSHYSVIDTRIASGKHLVRALQDMGFREVEIHAEAQPLVGWTGDSRASLAHIIVRRRQVGAASNDIGFFQTPGGYFQARISDFDQILFGGKWLERLTQRYSYHVATDMLAEKGFEPVEEKRDGDGTVRLTLRRMV
jgi:hypothetical protein